MIRFALIVWLFLLPFTCRETNTREGCIVEVQMGQPCRDRIGQTLCVTTVCEATIDDVMRWGPVRAVR